MKTKPVKYFVDTVSVSAREDGTLRVSFVFSNRDIYAMILPKGCDTAALTAKLRGLADTLQSDPHLSL